MFLRENAGFLPVGYLLSMNVPQESGGKTQQNWTIDICVAMPDERDFNKGGRGQ